MLVGGIAVSDAHEGSANVSQQVLGVIFPSGGGQLVDTGRRIDGGHHPGVAMLGKGLDRPGGLVQVATGPGSDLLLDALVFRLPGCRLLREDMHNLPIRERETVHVRYQCFDLRKGTVEDGGEVDDEEFDVPSQLHGLTAQIFGGAPDAALVAVPAFNDVFGNRLGELVKQLR